MSKLKAFEKYEAFVLLVYCAIVLILMEYFFIPPRIDWRGPSLTAGIVWSLSCIICFLILPTLITTLVFKRDLREAGFFVKGFLSHLKVYLLTFVAIAPFIYFASTRSDFTHTYPFIPTAKSSLPNFLIWEVAYVLQFWALESFFR